MSEQKTFKFDDTIISTIAKTLQLALLTGTDVVDNLRQIEVQENENFLDKINKSTKRFVINILDKKNIHLANLYKMHKSLSYRRTLARGYSIIRDKKKNLITNKTSALEAKELKIEFNEDMLDVEVKFDK